MVAPNGALSTGALLDSPDNMCRSFAVLRHDVQLRTPE